MVVMVVASVVIAEGTVVTADGVGVTSVRPVPDEIHTAPLG